MFAGWRDAPGALAAEPFFRWRAPSARFRGWQLAGSVVCHAFVLLAALAMSRVAPPLAPAPLPLPEVQITWYGAAKDVVPKIAPRPKQPWSKPHPPPEQAHQEMVTRGYNPNTTVVFQPPHATNRRQLLIEPDAPPELPKFLPAMPNIIRWVEAGEPARPALAIQPNQLRAAQRKRSEQAILREPQVGYQTPSQPTDMFRSPRAPAPPAPSIPPKAIHGVRAALSGGIAAAAPELGRVAPAGIDLAFAPEKTAALAPPLPAGLGNIHARRTAGAAAIVGAPSVRQSAGGTLALSFSPGSAAPAAPLTGAFGAIHGRRAGSSYVSAARGSPEVGTPSLGSSTLRLPTTSSAVPLPSLPSAPTAARARSSGYGFGSGVAAPSIGFATGRLVSLSLSPGMAPPPPGNAYAPMSIGPHPGRTDRAAAASTGSGGSDDARGLPAPEGSLTGPEGLLILHDANAPAPPPVPQPIASAHLNPAPAASGPVSAGGGYASVPAPGLADPSISSQNQLLTGPISVGHNVLLVGVILQDLVNRTIGTWHMPTLSLNVPNLSNSRGMWVLDFADPLPPALRGQNKVIVPLPDRAVEPPYPAALRQEGVRGKVVLRAVIGSNGKVSQIRVMQSLNPVLDHMAQAAFSRWEFEPALLNDRPIAMPVIVTVPFR